MYPQHTGAMVIDTLFMGISTLVDVDVDRNNVHNTGGNMLFTQKEQKQVFSLIKKLVEDGLSEGGYTYDRLLDAVASVKGEVTISTIEDYIRGLPSCLPLPYITYDICCLIEAVVKRFIPDAKTTDVDSFYWHAAALVLYKKGDVC